MIPVKENVSHSKDCCIYPGEYMPLPGTEELIRRATITGKKIGTEPLINIEELDDCFKVEMMVPGAKRENLFLHTRNNMLTVIVLHNECDQKKEFQVHEFDTKCIERNILLPVNADTEFISAEYRQGILTMHIPKNLQSPYPGIRQIVVY